MRQSVILFTLLLLSITSWAQDDWVLTMANDTIYGKIGFIVMDEYRMDEVQVKEGKTKHRFTPIETKRINKNGVSYIPYKVDGKYQFAQVKMEGYLSWLYYMNPESNGYEDFSIILLAKLDGTYTKVSNIGFMKAVGNFLDDCEPLTLKIENNEYKAKNLEDIVNFYNDCVDRRSNSRVKVMAPVDEGKLQIINGLISAVTVDKKLSSNTELVEMLVDIKGKINDGKSIPGFLKNGVLDALGENAELVNKFNSLFE